MRAITISEYGGSPVVTELPKPKAGPGQVLIKVRAASVNPMDRNIAGGGMKEQMPGTFPMVLGADLAGVVEALGEGATKFSPGEEVFGQLLVAPLGSAGTYAEDVAVTEEAPLASVPAGMDPVVAAAIPTAGGSALDIVDLLEPLAGKTVLIVGAAGGVGSFVTQFAANAGAHVIANAHESADERMRSYGAAETVDHNLDSVMRAVAAGHPGGIDILIDVASDAGAFAELATLVKRGGIALTTTFVADTAALNAGGITGVNYVVRVSPELLERVADELVAGRIAAPPIRDIRLDDVPAAFKAIGHGDGKTVITMVPH